LAYGSEIDAKTGAEIEDVVEGKKVIVRDPGKTPLLLACFNNKTNAAVFLIQKGADVNAVDYYDYSPFHAAAVCADLESTKHLLEKGARTDFRTSYSEFGEELGWESGFAPLHIAARNGHVEILELLLSHGATIDIGDRWERTPLMFAARMGHCEAVEILLDHDAKANSRSQADPTRINRAGIGTTSLHHAVEGEHQEVVEKLIEYGASIDALNKWAESPLHFAAADGLTQIAELLLDNGAAINRQDVHGMTPLDRAHSSGHIDTADMISNYLHSGFAFDQVQAKALQMLRRINGIASDRNNPLTELVSCTLIDDSGCLQRFPGSELEEEHFDLFLELTSLQPKGTEKELFKIIIRERSQVPDNLEALPRWADFLVLLLLEDRDVWI
jgi:ankyrin repeat protein